jgi:predicted peroxiredoxin
MIPAKGDFTMEKKKFVFIVTHSYDRPDLAAGAMQLAANMKAFDTEVDFFLMDEGVLLAKKGFAETLTWQKKDEFSPLSELIKTLVEDFGVKFYICASCVKHYNLDKAELIANAEVKPGSFLGQMLLERQGLTF